MQVTRIILLFFLLMLQIPWIEALPRVPVQQVVFQNNRFAFDLYRKMAEKPGNFVFSPYAISAGFAIAYLGTKEKTEESIADFFHFKLPPGYLGESFRQIDYLVGDDRGYKLASSLWVQSKSGLEQSFLDRAQTFFAGRLQETDFTFKSDSARAEINSFVSQKTNKAITAFLSISDLSQVARLQVICASFFEGRFLYPSDSKRGGQRPFFMTQTRSRSVPMLSFEGSFPIVQEEDFTILEMPFTKNSPDDEGIGLMILITKEIDGLKTLDKLINFETLSGSLGNMGQKRVLFECPRFRLQPITDLKPIFESMGLKNPFSQEANFSALSQETKFSLQKTVDKTTFQLAEKGVNFRLGPLKPQEPLPALEGEAISLIANRPFIFFVYDNRSNQILLLGRCQDP